MHWDTKDTEEPRLLARGLAVVVGFVARHPYLVLGLTLLSCIGCGLYTWKSLTYLTRRNDLISKRKDYLKRWNQYVAEFGDDDDMVVVVKGTDRPAMEQALDELAAEIQKRPDAFERLFYKVDLRGLNNRSLLFLPTSQIRQIQDQLQGMSLLLEPPVLGTLDPWFGWRSLSVQQLFRESERRLGVWKSDQTNAEAEGLFRQFGSICDGAAEYLRDQGRYKSPWRSVMPEVDGGADQEYLNRPQYFFSGDGSLAMLLVGSVKDTEAGGFMIGQKSIEILHELIARVKQNHPGLEFGLTGLPVLENDEMAASESDSTLASWLALGCVALLYFGVYRGFRFPLTTVATLLVGTIWAFGWLTLTVGHLNILSAAFAVMLIGIGDYAVLFVSRFGRERRAGRDIAEAMRRTAMDGGPSIVTAAVTTALAFFAAMLADLQAVSELGWIAGCGVLLCAVSCFVVTPALLAILDYRGRRTDRQEEMCLSIEDHRAARREWLPALMGRSGWVLAGSVLVTLALAGFASQIHYDHNLLHMQAQGLPSVQWEKTLIEHTTGSSWYAVSWTATPEEALALKTKFEQLPEVASVVTVASIIPAEQDRKMEFLSDLQQRLRKLPPRGEVLEHMTPSLAEINQTGARLIKTLVRLQEEKPSTSLVQLRESVERLLAALGASAGVDAATAAYNLQQYEQFMTRDLAEDLHHLRAVSTPVPIRVADLPDCLRERYVGKSGAWLLRIFSKDCLWNFEPLDRFVAQVRTVDGDATGKPFTTLEGLRAMRNGFLWSGFYALLVMVAILFLDFGNVKHLLLSLLPLAMGIVAALGGMAMFGIALNPANTIALPLILGVGVDNGVHVLHDFRIRDRRKRYALNHVIGFGITVKALTTVIGFGMLMIAQHRGMASLGLVLTVGVSCCMLAALVFLPALLHVMGKRQIEPDAVLERAPWRDAA